MAEEDAKKTLYRRFVGDIINGGRYELIPEIFDPGYVDHSAPPGAPGGLGGVAAVFKMFRGGFPDAVQRVDDIFALGDRVVVRLTWEGTHLGDFMGTPATGKKVSVETIGIDRVVDGKVVEGWGQLDMLGLLTTIGAVVPATPVAEPAKS